MNQETTIYLDNAATTPLDERVLDAMIPYLRNHFGNPSSVHRHGREARVAIEKARKSIAALLNASPGEIIFTSGGTEADNTAIQGAAAALKIQQIITSPLEHHAVLHACEAAAKAFGIPLYFLEVDSSGNYNLSQLESLLSQSPASLVSLMHGNNEIGNLADLRSIGDICRHYGAFFHSDTVQTVGHFPHDLKNTPVDAIAAAAHKFHGPKGVGLLYLNKSRKIHPYLYGGSQERNMRGGTENVAGIVGLSVALQLAHEEMTTHTNYITDLKAYFMGLLQKQIPGVTFNGNSGKLNESLYTVLNVSFPPSPNNQGMLLFNLDLEGISVSGGSACSSGATLGSHVLQALACTPERESVRFSFSRFNTKEELDFTIKKLQELYA